MKLSSSNIKKFLTFPRKKRNGNPEDIPYISGSTSKAPKPKIS